MLMISLPFGSDLFEQFGFGSLQVASEFHSCFQSLGIDLETFSQFFRSRIVKEGNILIEIGHDKLITQLMVTLHVALAPATNGFEFALGHERLYVEQFYAAGLKQRCNVARTVICCENKGIQLR